MLSPVFALANAVLPSTTPDRPGIAAPIATMRNPARAGIGTFPIATVNTQPILSSVLDNVIVTATLPTATTNPVGSAPGTVVLSVASPLVTTVTINGVTFTPVQDASNPAGGTFLQDPYGGTVTLYWDAQHPAPPTYTALLTTAQPNTAIPNLRHIAPPYPDWFYRFPLNGTISWSLSPEQHPTGKMQFVTNHARIGALRSAFKIGNRFSLYGIGFQVANFNEDQEHLYTHRGGKYTVSVSLCGWHEEICTRPVPYLSNPNVNPASPKTIDPDCVNVVTRNQLSTTARVFSTVAELGAVLGVQVDAPNMKIVYPDSLTTDSTTTLQAELEPRVRQNGCFLDWTQAGVVTARPLTLTAPFSIQDALLLEKAQLSRQGKTKIRQDTVFDATFQSIDLNSALPSTPLSPPAITVQPEDTSLNHVTQTFPKVRLAGRFSSLNPTIDPVEDNRNIQNAQPRWKQRSPVYRTTQRGDLDVQTPPAVGTPPDPLNPGVPSSQGWITSVSMNASSSGKTKTLETVTTRDGVEAFRSTETWGFAFLTKDWVQIVSASFAGVTQGLKRLRVNPFSTWTMVKLVTSETVFDEATGYIIGNRPGGWELRRYQEETDAMETYFLSLKAAGLDGSGRFDPNNLTVIQGTTPAAVAARKLKTYLYEKVPIVGAQASLLRRFRPYYRDTPLPPTIAVKACNLDGTSRTIQVRDKAYTEPYWEDTSTTQFSSYNTTPNPAPPKKVRNPTTGESFYVDYPALSKGRQTFNSKKTVIFPSSRNKASIAQDSNPTDDLYVDYTSEFSAEGAGYAQFAEKTEFAESYGKPPEARKLPSRFELIQPETNGNVLNLTGDQSSYFAFTPGYDLTSPQQGSQSFPYCLYFSEVQTAVNTDATIKDVTSASRTLSCALPFHPELRPLMRIPATVNGVQYGNRINTVECELKIIGVVAGQLELEGSTKVTLSPDRSNNITFATVPNVPNPNAAEDQGLAVDVLGGDAALGSVLPDNVPRRA